MPSNKKTLQDNIGRLFLIFSIFRTFLVLFKRQLEKKLVPSVEVQGIKFVLLKNIDP
jgi:hypothetical protein